MILSIDQGTTGTTALLVDDDARIIARGYAPVRSSFPRPGWVEQDPLEIWCSVERSVHAAVSCAPLGPIVALGVTNQRETVVAWDAKTLKPLAKAIVWQDGRASAHMSEIQAGVWGDSIRGTTGLRPSPYFSAGKLVWLLRNSPEVKEAQASGRLRFGTIDSWLIARLSNGAYVTDATNASRTLLFDLNTGDWSQEMLDCFEIPRGTLPEIVPSIGRCAVAHEGSLVGRGVPVSGIAGDQQSALFGHLAISKGATKVTYGTGCFLLHHAGGKRPADIEGLLTTVALAQPTGLTYAYEGSVFTGGALVQWFRDELGLINSAEEIEALAHQVVDTAGAVIVPAFTGLGAPHWDSEARGAVLGLTRGVTAAHLARAALEAIAHQVEDVLEIMPEASDVIHVDGGASANRLLLQLQAEVSGCRLVRPLEIETTALGAAWLAGISEGVWADTREIGLLRDGETVIDQGQASVSIDRVSWRRAVKRAKHWTSTCESA